MSGRCPVAALLIGLRSGTLAHPVCGAAHVQVLAVLVLKHASLHSSKFKCQSRYPSDEALLRCQVLRHALPGGGGNGTLLSLPPPTRPRSEPLVLSAMSSLVWCLAHDIHAFRLFQDYPYSYFLIPLITLNSN